DGHVTGVQTCALPISTLMGKSAFPETHELHFGWPGMHGPKWSNWGMNKCDVLVAVGARFDDRVTGKLAAFAPGATVVHLDIDARSEERRVGKECRLRV